MTQVPKFTDGVQTGIRDCHDLRQVNTRVPRDVYPLPNIADIFDALRGAAFMCASGRLRSILTLATFLASRLNKDCSASPCFPSASPTPRLFFNVLWM